MADFTAILGPARIRRREGGNPTRRLQIVHYGDSPTSPQKYARYFHGLMERTRRARARAKERFVRRGTWRCASSARASPPITHGHL